MSVNAGMGKIKRACTDLQVRWNEAKVLWRDPNSQQFEDQFLEPLLAVLRTAEKAMGHMDDVLSKARRDCT